MKPSYALLVVAIVAFPAALASFLMWWDRYRSYYMTYYPSSARRRALRDWAGL
jgi:hypothetical protein